MSLPKPDPNAKRPTEYGEGCFKEELLDYGDAQSTAKVDLSGHEDTIARIARNAAEARKKKQR